MNRGFTLIEALLYMAIASVIIGALFGAFQFIDNARLNHAVVNDLAAESSFATQRIVDLVHAGELTGPGPGESASLLTFDDGTSVALQGDTLVESGPGGTARLTSAHVQVVEATFSNMAVASGSDIIRFELRLRSESTASGASISYEYEYTTSVTPR